MPPFLKGLRKLLGLQDEPAPKPEPHPLEPVLNQELSATQSLITKAGETASAASANHLAETLAVLRLQTRQAVGVYQTATDEKSKTTASGVLEKLQAKIAGVKADAGKLGEESLAAKKRWESLNGDYQEGVKLISEMAEIAPGEAGILGTELAAVEKARDEKNYGPAADQLGVLLPKITKAFEEAAAKFDSTTEVEALHARYLSRTPIKSDNPLDDLEARVESLNEIEEAITAWLQAHTGIGRPAVKVGEKTLATLRATVATERRAVEQERDGIRKANQAKLLEQIKNADAGERSKLSADKDFVAQLERNLPPKALEYARKQLGMSELYLEIEGFLKNIDTETDNEILWDQKSILGADFLEYLKFETDKIEKADNPELKKKITVPAGLKWKDEGSGQMLSFTGSPTLEVVGTGPNGEMRFTYGAGKFGLIKKKVPLPSGGKVTIKEVTHKRENTPLFPETPSKAHVQQGGLGDCYLIAALASLVAKDPGAIEDMMNDKGGTVTVRLFDVTETGDKKEFKPRFFNIEKSVARDGGGKAQYADNSIWVQMLEKAYAAGGYSGSADKKALAKYENIADGLSAYAYQVLTGQPAKFVFYDLGAGDRENFAQLSTDDGTGKPKYSGLPWAAYEKSLYKGITTPREDLRQMISWEIFGGKPSLIHQWMAYVSGGDVLKLINREFSGGYSGELTIDDFADLFKGKIAQPDGTEIATTALNSTIAGPVLAWLRSNGIYPGKRGTPEYSKLQLQMYGEIDKALGSGKLVALSSKEKVARESSGVGRSGGETMGNGLVGTHAYSVLKTRDDGGLRSLLIRNPWGKTVQRNITVAERISEIGADTEIQEYGRNATLLADLPNQIQANNQVLESSPPVSERVKAFAKKDVLQGQYKTLLQRQAAIEAKPLYKERALLQKKSPTELIPLQTDQSSDAGLEGGEFWLPLFDLTQRFRRYHIC